MIERLGELESVGSEAVQAGIEHLETHSRKSYMQPKVQQLRTELTPLNHDTFQR